MSSLHIIIDFLCRQLLSGRWLLTVAAAVILVHWSWTFPSDKVDKLIDIVKDIVIFYFIMRPANETKTMPQDSVNGGSNAQTDSPVVSESIQQPNDSKV